MPIITIKLSGKPDPSLSRRVAEGVVEITSRVLRKNPAITAVAVDYTEPEHWIVGGQTLAEHRKASYWLDIRVVDGTNTKDEKAQYLAEIHALMGRLLGELHTESYAHVHEVFADAYGFGGLTQEERYIASRLAPRAAA